MKFFLLACLGWGILSSLFAEQQFPEATDDVLLNRAQLYAYLQDNLDEEIKDQENLGSSQKSIPKAVLLSAVLPGAGQFYAKSYIKAAAFLAIEAVAWAINISYDKKGDDKDTEFRAYADRNWSEQQYWSYVYLQLQDMEIEDLPNYDEYLTNDSKPVLTNWRDAKQVLDKYENTLPGYSHQLPDTKTQQYYEMIGKYPRQFGNAWADASYYVVYQDFGEGNVTEMNALYATMRDDANRFYDIAGYGSMVALLNHVISAIDAGFTTRGHNRRHSLQFSYQNRRIMNEYVNMFGLDVRF